jgi:hypothetical protein
MSDPMEEHIHAEMIGHLSERAEELFALEVEDFARREAQMTEAEETGRAVWVYVDDHIAQVDDVSEGIDVVSRDLFW